MNKKNIRKEQLKEKIITSFKNDFYRHAHMHSWYKHLPIKPIPFVFFLEKGEQIRTIDDKITDPEGIHWHFLVKSIGNLDRILSKVKQGITIYETKFGAFLRGHEHRDKNGIFIYGYHGYEIILNSNPSAHKYLKKKYPNLYGKKRKLIYDENISEIFIKEQESYLQDALKFKKATMLINEEDKFESHR